MIGSIDNNAVMVMLTAYTVLCGLEDFRKRQIRTGRSMLFAGLGIFTSLLMGRNWAEIGLALLPGLAFLAISRISRGSVGPGDAVYLLVCAAYADMERLLLMIVFSLLLSAAAALCIIVRGTFRCMNVKHKTLPYLTFMIPALLGSFLVYRPV
ncbi:MAG: prepilin peptidase [Lachnospiraceae bacterium]|nr:prepilin peptidase [Lachnospiraceae bacterium]